MSAKEIIVKPISSQDAARIVKSCHYSGKVVQNSQLHFGVFLDGKCGGAMQFGPSLDKRKIQGLVEGTGWNGFLELNRMAFADWLPRNSESRAIAVAMRLIRKTYPHIEWVVSFADGTQCGDGTIYRASGFVLTGIKENTQIWEAPSGEKFSRMSLTDGRSKQEQAQARKVVSRSSMTMKGKNGGGNIRRELAAEMGSKETGGASMKQFSDAGWKPLPGFQLRYIYFLNPAAKSRLTVPILPFSEIERRGAGMYLGKPKRAESIAVDAPCIQQGEGSASLTSALQSDDS
jgi:hypothetical protein